MKRHYGIVLALLCMQICFGTDRSEAQDARSATSYVPAKAFAVLRFAPESWRQDKALELLPFELAEAVGNEQVGFDPSTASEILGFVGGDPSENEMLGGLVLRFSQPVELSGLYIDACVEQEVAGTTVLVNPQQIGAPAFYQPNPTTVLIAEVDSLSLMVAATDDESAIRQMLGDSEVSGDQLQFVMSFDTIGPVLSQQLAQEQLPPPFSGLATQVGYLDRLAIRAGIGDHPGLQLDVWATDEKGARSIERTLVGISQSGRLQIESAIDQIAADMPGASADAMRAYGVRLAESIISKLQPVREGEHLSLKVDTQISQTASAGVMIALLLPAVQAAREAARRTSAANNLKQIMLAQHNFAVINRDQFTPRAIRSAENGQPLLSWRVMILPYIEQQALYDQFRLDEPWDSVHNKALIARMPDIYRSPNGLPEGWTNIQAIDHPKGLFSDPKGTSFSKIIDGLSNTIAVVEVDANRAVPWTSPEDWSYDETDPLAGLGGLRAGGFQVGFADGSVRFISNDIDLEVWKALLTMGAAD